MDLPEPQGEPRTSPRRRSCCRGQIDGPTLVEDTSPCYNALHGLPGPCQVVPDVRARGPEQDAGGVRDKSAYAQCVFAYVDGPKGEPKVSWAQPTDDRAGAGPTDFGWDPVFQPDGFEETYAEMDKAVQNSISHRYRALDKFREFMVAEAAGRISICSDISFVANRVCVVSYRARGKAWLARPVPP